MSSNMTQIDEGFIQYPVPGIDNDSQGFRDRYNIIRTNLNTAKTEISSLITNTAKLNVNNNFGGNDIIDVNLRSTTFEANTSEDGEPVAVDTLPISWNEGSLHVIRVGDSATPLSLTFINWPAENRFAKITLVVNPPESGSRTISWPAGVKKKQITPTVDAESVISVGGTKIFEIFTYDGGTTLFVDYLGLYE